MTNFPVSKRLKQMRVQAELSVRKIAEIIGVSPSSYQHYEDKYKKEFFPMHFVEKIRGPLVSRGINEDDVMRLAGAIRREIDEPAKADEVLVPVYEVEASAGHGALVYAEDHVANLAFSHSLIREMTFAPANKLAVIKVRGDSMEPTLLDDDQVLIDTTKTDLNFDGMFVLSYDGVLHVKRIGRTPKRGHVMITSDNPAYQPFEAAHSDIDVVGRVLWYGRKV